MGNKGLEFAKQILAASKIRHKMCSTSMEESSALRKEVSMFTADMEYICQHSFQALVTLWQEMRKEN